MKKENYTMKTNVFLVSSAGILAYRYHGLLHQEDGIFFLSRRVKACRVGQIHGVGAITTSG